MSLPGVAPTPDTQATRAKSGMIKSMARRDDRVQREEILTARRFLQRWYGTDRTPQLSEDARRMISMLEAAPAGDEFDKLFMQQMGLHHYKALHLRSLAPWEVIWSIMN